MPREFTKITKLYGHMTWTGPDSTEKRWLLWSDGQLSDFEDFVPREVLNNVEGDYGIMEPWKGTFEITVRFVDD